MANSMFLGSLVRLGLAGCERGILAASVLLFSATAALAGAPTPGGETEVDVANGLAEIGAFAPGAVGLVAADQPPTLLALEPIDGAIAEAPDTVSTGGTEAAVMFRVNDLEAGFEADSTVRPDSDLAQVTRVSDFSDVLPSDWAFQALSNLVETYGCLQGYPDGTFRGQRSLTRFEFAAGLNSCLDVVVGLISTLPEEDLVALLRLQEEFAAELTTMGGRVDQLEAETAQLRAQQFSTVTKLRGQAFFNLATGFANGSVLAERAVPGNLFAAGRDEVTNAPFTQSIDRNPGTPVGGLAWLNLDTSFTGSDRLKLQLTAGSGSGIGNFFGSAGLINTFGVPFTFQGGGVTGDYSVYLRELSYAFPLGDSLTVDIGPRINWYGYFDQNRYTFFVTGANSFNSSSSTLVNSLDRGAGAIVVWNVVDWLDFRVGYLAENNEFLPGPRTASDPSRGLFGGTSTLTGQVGLRPFNNLNLRFLYTRSNIEPAPRTGFIGGAFQPIYGLADDGSGGPLTNAPADTFVVNFDWTPTNWLGLFGRYSYGSTQLTSATSGLRLGDVNAQAFQFGLAFPNLFKEGAQATLSYVIPFDVTSGREFLVSGGGDGGTQQELEFSYRYPLSRNIALMPSVYWIMNANNFGSNPDIFIFNLQTQFSF